MIPAVLFGCDQVPWSWLTEQLSWVWATFNSHLLRLESSTSLFPAPPKHSQDTCEDAILTWLKYLNLETQWSLWDPYHLCSLHQSICSKWMSVFPERIVVTPSVCSHHFLRLHYKLGNLWRWLSGFTPNFWKWALGRRILRMLFS